MLDDDGHDCMLDKNGIEYVSPAECESIENSNARREKLNRQIRAAAKRKRKQA